MAPPGVDADVLASLRTAFEAALTSEELIEMPIESRRPITFVKGKDIAKAIANEAELARQFAPIV